VEIYQYEEPPIYGDKTSNIDKTSSLSWYNIYEEFMRLNIPETQEDLPIYLNIKRSKLHKRASHPPIFLCAETIDWVLQNKDTYSWMVRDHIGAPLATISPSDISTYYKLLER